MHKEKKKFLITLDVEEIDNGFKSIDAVVESEIMQEFESQSYLRPKQNVNLLMSYRDLEFEMARLIAGWIPSVSELELKMDLARQSYLFMQIVGILESRLIELPGYKHLLGGNRRIRQLRDIVGKAFNYEEFLVGVYNVIQVKLSIMIEDHFKKCDPIADLPTIDRLENILPIIRNQVGWVQKWTADYSEKSFKATKARIEYISQVFDSFDILNVNMKDIPPSPYDNHSLQGPCAEPARLDESYNVVEKFLYGVPRETQGKITDILYHNFSELFVPDALSYMIYEIDDMPYEFYRDFIKQLWDESRHTNMGLRELEKLGISVKNLPLNRVKKEESHTFFLALIGYTVEGCSFSRKLTSADAFFKLGLHSAAIVTEYDIVDESQHIKYIKKWLPVLHRKEGCKKPLKQIIVEAQQESLRNWSGVIRLNDYNNKIEKLSSKLGNFGTFCREIEFEIDFSKI